MSPLPSGSTFARQVVLGLLAAVAVLAIIGDTQNCANG